MRRPLPPSVTAAACAYNGGVGWIDSPEQHAHMLLWLHEPLEILSLHVYPPHPRAATHPERCPFGLSEGCHANRWFAARAARETVRRGIPAHCKLRTHLKLLEVSQSVLRPPIAPIHSTYAIVLAEAAAARVGKLLFVGEFGGPPPNFTGPGVDDQVSSVVWEIEPALRRS